ncbi:hypothetical protein WD019_02990 [Fictibacillus sp. Mic-4]|uniref:hypothetical protein n=1 Tax=Fictibacillus sp. Mic-4 TaxID=3132826 RepID=UPI003CF062E5
MENELRAMGFVIQPRLSFKNVRDQMIYQFFMCGANFESNSVCKRGQLVISISSLCEETGWPYGVIRGAINRLEKHGYISTETLSQKRGIKVTITDYNNLQSLENYRKMNKENNNEDNKEGNKQDNKWINKQDEAEIPFAPTGEGDSKIAINKENNKQNDKENNNQNNKQVNNTITSFNNIIINSNINNIKHYLKDLPGRLLNLTSETEIESFVDFAEKVNPLSLTKKIVVRYFNTIRLTRSTCKISANVLATLWEKFQKYNTDQLHFAMLQHCIHHDDKKEQYTLGILRNTDIHEARRKLLVLINKNAREEIVNAISQQSDGEYHYGF